MLVAGRVLFAIPGVVKLVQGDGPQNQGAPKKLLGNRFPRNGRGERWLVQ